MHLRPNRLRNAPGAVLLSAAALLWSPEGSAAQTGESSIADAVRGMLAAVSAGNVDGLRAQYVPDARIFVEYDGLLELDVQQWLDLIRGVDWEPAAIESHVMGRTAVTVAVLSGLLPLPGGLSLEGPFRYSETRVRDGHGWRIVQQELSPVGSAFAERVGPPGATSERALPSAEVARPPARVQADLSDAESPPAPAASAPAVRSAPASVEILGPPAPVAPEVIARDAEGGATVRAVRVTEPHRVDGALDESIYATTPPISSFVQTLPDEGAEPTERTEAWIAFDDDNVYVSARVWDSGGEGAWIANEMRRDAQQLRVNDNFGVYLDTYYDRRNSVGFYVNALGGFTDQQIMNEGNPNRDWNPVTDIRTGRFEGGWTVEMAIPFRTLRYRPGREQTWGIQLRRSVARKNEWNYLTFVPIAAAGANGSQGTFRVSRYGTLVGIEAPPPRANFELKPYAIAGLRTDLAATPAIRDDGSADAGLDVKYGVTQNLTADFTFNPDFAQVEADEQQVNLTRFSLFFPEKREFFLEAAGIFNFGVGGRSGGGGGGGGEGGGGGGTAPTLFYSRGIGLQSGAPVPIIAGGRVTGKVGSFDVGAVNIQTDDEIQVGAEPTNFTVLRLRRDIFARSSLGVLFENRSRSVVAGRGSNQAWGVDGWFALSSEVGVLGYYAETYTPGLTGLTASYRSQVTWDADQWGGRLDHLVVGDDFNPEIGFARRRGFRQSVASGRVSPRPRSIDWLRQITLQGDIDYIENEAAGFVESRERGGQLRLELENSDQLGASFTDTYENLVQDERISGALIPAGRYGFREGRVFFTFGPQRPWSASLSVRKGSYYGGDVTSVALNQGRVELTPRLSVEPNVSLNWIRLPQGRFDQHVAVTRLTYTLTPRMFVSGLVQYNSGSDSFSSDFRLRWEWAPGSELFLVYTEARSTDVLDRWSELVNRGLVIKVNRLLRL